MAVLVVVVVVEFNNAEGCVGGSGLGDADENCWRGGDAW